VNASDWVYKDEMGVVQGPFSRAVMRTWVVRGFFDFDTVIAPHTLRPGSCRDATDAFRVWWNSGMSCLSSAWPDERLAFCKLGDIFPSMDAAFAEADSRVT
jgi:hypothetical protein